MTAFRPRTPAEMKALHDMLALVTGDARSLIESYGDDQWTAGDLLAAVEPLHALADLLADLTAHATAGRRKKGPARRTPAKSKAATAETPRFDFRHLPERVEAGC